MKNLLLLVFVVSIGCFTKNQTQNMNKKEENEKFLNLNEAYEDFNLFTFKPVGLPKNGLKNSVKFIINDTECLFTLQLAGDTKKIKMTKNKNGNWIYIKEINDSSTIMYKLYTFYADKIVVFDFIKIKGEKDMRVGSFQIIYELFDLKYQKGLRYEYYKNVIFEAIKITNPSNFDVEDALQNLDKSKKKPEYLYEFDFESLENKCFQYHVEKKTNKKILMYTYDIYNSKSVASPYYFFWKPYASEIIDNWNYFNIIKFKDFDEWQNELVFSPFGGVRGGFYLNGF